MHAEEEKGGNEFVPSEKQRTLRKVGLRTIMPHGSNLSKFDKTCLTKVQSLLCNETVTLPSKIFD